MAPRFSLTAGGAVFSGRPRVDVTVMVLKVFVSLVESGVF